MRGAARRRRSMCACNTSSNRPGSPSAARCWRRASSRRPARPACSDELPFGGILADLMAGRQHISNQYEYVGSKLGGVMFGLEDEGFDGLATDQSLSRRQPNDRRHAGVPAPSCSSRSSSTIATSRGRRRRVPAWRAYRDARPVRAAGAVGELLRRIALHDQEPAGFERAPHAGPFQRALGGRRELREDFGDDVEGRIRIGPGVHVGLDEGDRNTALRRQRARLLLRGGEKSIEMTSSPCSASHTPLRPSPSATASAVPVFATAPCTRRGNSSARCRKRRNRGRRSGPPSADIRSNQFSVPLRHTRHRPGCIYWDEQAYGKHATRKIVAAAGRSDVSAATSPASAPSAAAPATAASRTSPCPWCRGRECLRSPGSGTGVPPFTRLSSRSMMPVSGGLRSSSAGVDGQERGLDALEPGDGL